MLCEHVGSELFRLNASGLLPTFFILNTGKERFAFLGAYFSPRFCGELFTLRPILSLGLSCRSLCRWDPNNTPLRPSMP